jgi:hypothetical protein
MCRIGLGVYTYDLINFSYEIVKVEQKLLNVLRKVMRSEEKNV